MKKNQPTWIARVKSRVNQRILSDTEAYCKAFIEEFDLNVRLADDAAKQGRVDFYHAAFVARHYARAAAAATYILVALSDDDEGDWDSEMTEGDSFFLLLAWDPDTHLSLRRQSVAIRFTAKVKKLRWLAFGWAAEAAWLSLDQIRNY